MWNPNAEAEGGRDLVGLLIFALGTEDPLLVDLPILIKVPCQDWAVATRSLALLDCLSNIQLALLNLQQHNQAAIRLVTCRSRLEDEPALCRGHWGP